MIGQIHRPRRKGLFAVELSVTRHPGSAEDGGQTGSLRRKFVPRKPGEFAMKYEVLIASTLLLAAAVSSRGATGMVNAGEVFLPTGVDAQYSAAVDTTTGFGYFGTSGSDPTGYVSKINLNGPTPTLVSNATEGIPSGIYGMLGVTVDSGSNPFQHDLYVGTATGQVLHMTPGTASTPPQWLSTITPNSGAIVHGFTDPGLNYAYFVARGSTSDNLVRVNMATGTYAGTVQLPIGESAAAGQMNSYRYGGIDTINHYAYLTNNIGFLNGHGQDNPDSPEICKINLQTAFKNSHRKLHAHQRHRLLGPRSVQHSCRPGHRPGRVPEPCDRRGHYHRCRPRLRLHRHLQLRQQCFQSESKHLALQPIDCGADFPRNRRQWRQLPRQSRRRHPHFECR